MFFIESIGIRSKAVEVEYKQVGYDAVLNPRENCKKIVFGYHTDTSARGVYTLETNSERPFLR